MRPLEMTFALKYPNFVLSVICFGIIFVLLVLTLFGNLVFPVKRTNDFDAWAKGADHGEWVHVVGVIEIEWEENSLIHTRHYYKLKGSEITIIGILEDFGSIGDKVALRVRYDSDGNFYGEKVGFPYLMKVFDPSGSLPPIFILGYGLIIPLFITGLIFSFILIIGILIEKPIYEELKGKSVVFNEKWRSQPDFNLDSEEFIDSVYKKLEMECYHLKDDWIEGYDVVIASLRGYNHSRRARFRNVIFIFTSFKHLDQKTIEDFTNKCTGYLLEKYGENWKTSLSRSMCFPVIFSEKIDQEAIEWVGRKIRKRYGMYQMPVIVNPRKNLLYYSQYFPINGVFMHDAFRYLIERNIRHFPKMKCHNCNIVAKPVVKRKISSLGLLLFMFYCCLLSPTMILALISLLFLFDVKEPYISCPHCGEELFF